MIWELPLRDYEAVATGRRTALVFSRRPLRIHPGVRIRVAAVGSPSPDRWTLVEVTDAQTHGDDQILSVRPLPPQVAVETPGGRLAAVVETGESGPAGITVTINGQTAVSVTAERGTSVVRVYPRQGDTVMAESVWSDPGASSVS